MNNGVDNATRHQTLSQKKKIPILTFLLYQRFLDFGNHTRLTRRLAMRITRRLDRRLARRLTRRLARRLAERAIRRTMRLYP